MPRRIQFEFSGFDKTIFANLTDNEVADILWSLLEKPLKMAVSHTTSTGDYFLGKGRGPRDPERVGSQAKPLGKSLFICQLKPGTICYGGAEEISFAYGPEITEPLPDKGPITAMVEDAFLKDFYDAGMHVWKAQSETHKLVTVTASRA